jgi:hypothetical protein
MKVVNFVMEAVSSETESVDSDPSLTTFVTEPVNSVTKVVNVKATAVTESVQPVGESVSSEFFEFFTHLSMRLLMPPLRGLALFLDLFEKVDLPFEQAR